MNGNTDFDQIAQTWLQDGATEMSDRSLQAALDEVHVTSQRRFGAARRVIPMNGNVFKLAAAAVVAVLVIAGGLAFLGRSDQGVGGQPPLDTPTPTPTATASPAVITPAPRVNSADTTGWVPFVSDRYGYEISHPPGAQLRPASRDWSLDLAGTDRESASDWFIVGNEGEVVAVAGLAADVPAGMTQDEWIAAAALGADPDDPCRASETWETVMVDGHEARFNRQPGAAEENGCEVTAAYVFIEDRVYVFAEQYGTFPELLKGFLSTVRFTDVGPSSPPATPSP